MRILMFGAGVIGTVYGYALSQAGADVTHYVRPGKKRLLENGITLRLLDGRLKPAQESSALYKLQLTETLAPTDNYDFYIVSVRHYQVDTVLPIICNALGKADVLFFNGNWAAWKRLTARCRAQNTCGVFPSQAAGTRRMAR